MLNKFELVNRKEESELKIDSNSITIEGKKLVDSDWLSPAIRFIGYDTIRDENNLPKEYYINEKKKTVVLKWDDDTITKVKTSKDDKFNAKFGFLLAYFQKNCGMSRTQANKYIDNLKVKNL